MLAGATRGSFLGGYRILRPLGEGEMGKVFLAAHESDVRPVAIQVLPPKKALEGGQALRRFRCEMELSQQVQHPNLARTLGVAQEGDIHFMIMEYIPGEGLYEAVKGSAAGYSASPTRLGSSSKCSTVWRTRTTRSSCTATSSPRTS